AGHIPHEQEDQMGLIRVTRGIAAVGQLQFRNKARVLDGVGGPSSGTTGSGVGAPKGSLYVDVTNATVYVNEGSAASPYWTPVSLDQHGLVGVATDWSKNAGRDTSITTTSSQDLGVRYFGLGIDETTNTAFTVSYPVGGPLLTMGTENQANFLSALGYGDTTPLWVPSTNGPLVIDVTFT